MLRCERLILVKEGPVLVHRAFLQAERDETTGATHLEYVR